MIDLATQYGKNKSFNDEDLFNDIEKFTYPEIGDFLRKHVGGKTPLPLADVLDKIGIDFSKEKISEEFTFGKPDLNYNEETKRLFVEDNSDMDEFGKALGYKRGDQIYKFNGRTVTIEKAKEIITEYYDNVKDGDVVTIVVYRPKGKNGKFKEKTLSAKAHKVKTVRKNQLTLKKDLAEKQAYTLKTWLGE